MTNTRVISKSWAYKKLKSNGYKVTKARKNLIDALMRYAHYKAVSQISKSITGANIASLYNNIYLFTKLKIVDKIYHDSKNYYLIPYDPENFEENYNGFYIDKNNQIKPFEISQQVKSLKENLSGHKISKIKILVLEK